VINMFWRKDKKKEKKKEKIKLKYKRKAKSNLPILKSSIQKITEIQTQNQPQKYRDKEFIKYRTRTLAKEVSETASKNSIAVLKEQIYNINYLSLLNNSSYSLQNNLKILDKIIDFVEKTDYLLDPKYTEDIWHIKAELYHLKSMIINQNIYSSKEIKEKINEITSYTSEHL